MAHKHCGRWRDRNGHVHVPGPKADAESEREYTARVMVPFYRAMQARGIDSSRCACDPKHPHRPVEEDGQ